MLTIAYLVVFAIYNLLLWSTEGKRYSLWEVTKSPDNVLAAVICVTLDLAFMYL